MGFVSFYLTGNIHCTHIFCARRVLSLRKAARNETKFVFHSIRCLGKFARKKFNPSLFDVVSKELDRSLRCLYIFSGSHSFRPISNFPHDFSNPGKRTRTEIRDSNGAGRHNNGVKRSFSSSLRARSDGGHPHKSRKG